MEKFVDSQSIVFYILCKNESLNIGKCIEALVHLGVKPIVIDSGSTDNTLEIIKAYKVQCIDYEYTGHCNAYNYLTQKSTVGYCGIIDADMEITPDLYEEIKAKANGINEIIISPIRMYIDGYLLKKGSLCPPKAIVFKNGRAYFKSVGHGEQLLYGLKTIHTKTFLHHNDLKSYSAYLQTQLRYAENFITRAKEGKLTWRDHLRLRTPLMIFITPAYSLFIKGGIFFKKGWLYALDRLIAETIMYRRSILEKIKQNR